MQHIHLLYKLQACNVLVRVLAVRMISRVTGVLEQVAQTSDPWTSHDFLQMTIAVKAK